MSRDFLPLIGFYPLLMILFADSEDDFRTVRHLYPYLRPAVIRDA